MTTNTDGAMPELPEPLHPASAMGNGYTADQMREYARAAIQQAAGAVPEGLMALGKTIATQDNRCTDAPIFIVQQRRMITGLDSAYCENHGWYNGETFLTDGEEFEALELCYNKDSIEPEEWSRTGYIQIWEFVTACFTEQGCKDFIAINGHNLKEPRIYAEGSFRNEEFRSLRKTLIELAAAPTPPAVNPASDAGSSGHLAACDGGGVTQPESLTTRLQRKCSAWGTYWRAPDSHGVEISLAQAVDLLEDALGVEVTVVAGLHDVITDALQGYRCSHHQQDDKNGGLPLTDVLTVSGASDIRTGREELELLADEIFTAIEDSATSQIKEVPGNPGSVAGEGVGKL